jgi:hypothetical protein
MYRVLVATSGPLTGDEFHLESVIKIGRSGDLAVQLIGPAVSRHHAELRVEEGGTTSLIDLGSRNGTFVGGEPIQQYTLRSGDSFEIGNSSFKFEERPGSPPKEDDLHLSLLSGPAEDVTAMFQRADIGLAINSGRPTTMPQPIVQSSGDDCQDPLHEMARSKNWKFCPVCGEAPSERVTGEHPVSPHSRPR